VAAEHRLLSEAKPYRPQASRIGLLCAHRPRIAGEHRRDNLSAQQDEAQNVPKRGVVASARLKKEQAIPQMRPARQGDNSFGPKGDPASINDTKPKENLPSAGTSTARAHLDV
jgi:hypothetical protein